VSRVAATVRTTNVRIDLARVEARLQNIAQARGLKARVGILDHDDDLTYENGARVGDVARWLEHGTQRMLARPYLRRARANAQARMREAARSLFGDVVRNRIDPAEAAGKIAAILADQIVLELDRAPAWAEPLSARTIKRKGHSIPLYETGLLREVQSWAVVDASGSVRGRGRPAR
jgi:hypothetical protein